VLDINDLYVDIPVDETAHITGFVLNLNNTAASAKKNYCFCNALS
jgi:hypothetical protein